MIGHSYFANDIGYNCYQDNERVENDHLNIWVLRIQRENRIRKNLNFQMLQIRLTIKMNFDTTRKEAQPGNKTMSHGSQFFVVVSCLFILFEKILWRK